MGNDSDDDSFDLDIDTDDAAAGRYTPTVLGEWEGVL